MSDCNTKPCSPPSCAPTNGVVEQPSQCCPSQFCHDGLVNLPERRRLAITGVEPGSRCLSTFPRSQRGFVIYDGNGVAVVSNQPNVPIPYLKNVPLDNSGHVIYGPDGVPIENDPPGVEALVATTNCGTMWRWSGRHGYRQKLAWNGCSFVMEADLSEAELADFPSVASPASCGQYEAVLVDKGGGTFGVGYRQSPSRFPGEVISYAGDELNMPPGWMVCDGRALDTTEYPSLYTAIGYSWGRTDDLFHLPDLRGRFLRGVDMGEGVDPDADARTAINGGSTGDAVGTYQEDAFQKHKHELENTMEAGSAVGTDTVIKTNTNLLLAGDVLLEVGVATEAGGGEPRVAVETRPVNAAVIFIIFTGCQIEL